MTFSTHTDYPVGSTPWGIVVGDFNGDGKPDIATTNTVANTASVLLNTGSGFAAHTDYPVGSYPRGIAVGDFNGDGILDIATANENASTASVLLNLGDGFATHTDYPMGGEPYGIAVGDFNSDGKPDIATANADDSGTISVLLNSGDGFATHADYTVGSGPWGIAVGDFNGDGKVDIATSNLNDNTASVLLNSGSGFAAHADYPVGNLPIGIAVGDFNGDGKLDIATTSTTTGTASVLLNTGSGFATHADYPVGRGPFGIAVGDFNGDGKPDIATANFGPSTVSVLLNTGSGFATHVDYTVGSGPQGIVVGNFTANGMLDIATANGDANTASVLLYTNITSSFTQQYTKSHTKHKSLSLTPHPSKSKSPLRSKTFTQLHSKSLKLSHSESLKKTLTLIKTHTPTPHPSKSITKSFHTRTDETRNHHSFSTSNSLSPYTHNYSPSRRTHSASNTRTDTRTDSRTKTLTETRTLTQNVNPEFPIHQNAQNKEQPAITKLADGGSVVTWTSTATSGASGGIYAQMYNADRSLRGLVFQVNGDDEGMQNMSSVAGLVGGDFVVTWQKSLDGPENYALFAQRFTSNGTRVGIEFMVNANTYTGKWGPKIAALDSGGFAITWASFAQDCSGSGVYARCYDQESSPLTPEFLVNTYTQGNQYLQSITGLVNGGFVITWTSEQEGFNIYGQLYRSDGSPQNGQFRINTATIGRQDTSSVTALSNGGFVVTWTNNTKVGAGMIKGQVYDGVGAVIGSEFQVSTNALNNINSQVFALQNGGFTVVWQGTTADRSESEIYAQEFNASFAKQGVTFQVNIVAPSLAMAPVGIGQNGSFTAVWQSVTAGVSELFGRTFFGESASSLPTPVGRREGTHEDEWIREEDEEIGSWGGELLEVTNGEGRLTPFLGGWRNPLWNFEQGLLPFETLNGRLTDMPRALGEWQIGARDAVAGTPSQCALGAVAVHLAKKGIFWRRGKNSHDAHLK